MKRKTWAMFVTIAMSFSTTSVAQVVLEAGVARSEKIWGGEVGIGYAIFVLGGLRLTPGVGAFVYQGESDRYYMDDNGGTARCRDSETGQYAASEKCDSTAMKMYARSELTYTLHNSATFGVGGRYMSDHLRPYATIELPIWERISLKASGGNRYYAAGVVARF